MEKAVPTNYPMFKRALAAKVKMPMGTDAVAGAHGQNAREIITRVKDGGQSPMDAIVGATSLAAESMGLAKQIGALAAGPAGRHRRRRRQPAAGHHGAAPRVVRHEGRRRLPERSRAGALRALMRVPHALVCRSCWPRRCRRPAGTQPAMQEWPVYGGDAGRHQVLAAGRHQSRECREPGHRVGMAARGQAARGVRHAARQLPEHAADDRQRAVRVDAVQPRRRARRGDGTAEVVVRSEAPTRTASRRTAPASCTAAWPRGATAAKLRIFLNSPLPADLPRRRDGHARRDLRRRRAVVDLSKVWSGRSSASTTRTPRRPSSTRISSSSATASAIGCVYKNDPPGDIRAFDARTGKQVWSFHTIPQRGEPGHETWQEGSTRVTGHTNVWAPMTLDVARGLLYVPVGTPSNDFYGGTRKGAGLFGESLVCLDAATGKRKWHFQIAHHGIWDYDPAVAAEPRHDHRRTASASTPSCSSRSRASRSSSIASPARRCGRSRSGRCRRATSRAKRRGPRSPFPPRRRRSASRA